MFAILSGAVRISSVVVHALVFSKMWLWFFVPLGLPAIGLPLAFGICLTVRHACVQASPERIKQLIALMKFVDLERPADEKDDEELGDGKDAGTSSIDKDFAQEKRTIMFGSLLTIASSLIALGVAFLTKLLMG